MKRNVAQRLRPFRKYNVRIDLTPSQLREIGAVAIIWNDVEDIFDAIMCLGIGLPSSLWLEVSTRINGFDGKVAIIKAAAQKNLVIPDEVFELISATIEKAAGLKTYRDSVVHSRPFNTITGVGETIRRRGRVEHILLTTAALKTLYKWLDAVRLEFVAVCGIFDSAIVMKQLSDADAPDLEKRLPEQLFQEYVALLQERQTKRKALPPLPSLPPEHPFPTKVVRRRSTPKSTE